MQLIEFTSLYCFMSVLSFSSSLILPPSHASRNLVFWMGKERNEPFWQCPTQLGKLGTHSHALTFPVGEITCQKSLLSLSCAVLTEG